MQKNGNIFDYLSLFTPTSEFCVGVCKYLHFLTHLFCSPAEVSLLLGTTTCGAAAWFVYVRVCALVQVHAVFL